MSFRGADLGREALQYEPGPLPGNDAEPMTGVFADPDRIEVTVVICAHNRPGLLERCLRRLAEVDYPSFTTIVVDSAPNSDGNRVLSKRYDAHYVVSPIKGVSRARNIGARLARGEIIAFLDDDMVPARGWLSGIVNGFSESRVAVVTGPWLPFERLPGGMPRPPGSAAGGAFGPSPFELGCDTPCWFERANFGGVGDGNFAIRRSAFGRPIEFEEQLGRGATIDTGEEHFLYFRVLEAGYAVRYQPEAVVFHKAFPDDPHSRRRLLAQSCAYAMYLGWRHPRYVWRIFRYYLQAVVGVRRPWRYPPGEMAVPGLRRLEILRGTVSGLLLFLVFLREQRRRTDGSRAVPGTPLREKEFATWTD